MLNASKNRILLERYIPQGPGKGADVDTWEKWIKENEPYVFFSESGGLRWYIDPLARKRKAPTARLRGPLRADIAGKSR